MRFRWYFELNARAALWVSGAVFAVLGVVLLFILPALFKYTANSDVVPFLRILGGIFLILGGLILVLMLAGLWLGRTDPDLARDWPWWINLLSGVLGAAAFAVPATFALPFILLLYWFRVSPEFTPGAPGMTTALILGAFFTLLGLIVDGVLIWILRSVSQNNPGRRRRHSGARPQGEPGA